MSEKVGVRAVVAKQMTHLCCGALCRTRALKFVFVIVDDVDDRRRINYKKSDGFFPLSTQNVLGRRQIKKKRSKIKPPEKSDMHKLARAKKWCVSFSSSIFIMMETRPLDDDDDSNQCPPMGSLVPVNSRKERKMRAQKQVEKKSYCPRFHAKLTSRRLLYFSSLFSLHPFWCSRRENV